MKTKHLKVSLRSVERRVAEGTLHRGMVGRIMRLIEECGWETGSSVSADSFIAWRILTQTGRWSG